jgi:hypothetical protein
LTDIDGEADVLQRVWNGLVVVLWRDRGQVRSVACDGHVEDPHPMRTTFEKVMAAFLDFGCIRIAFRRPAIDFDTGLDLVRVSRGVGSESFQDNSELAVRRWLTPTVCKDSDVVNRGKISLLPRLPITGLVGEISLHLGVPGVIRLDLGIQRSIEQGP